MTGQRTDLPTTRLMLCLNCHKQRVCDFGICRPCADLPPREGESPHKLTGTWVKHPTKPIRVYVEQVA